MTEHCFSAFTAGK